MAELRAAGAVDVHDDCAAMLRSFDDSYIGRRLRAITA